MFLKDRQQERFVQYKVFKFFFLSIGWSYPHDLSQMFFKRIKLPFVEIAISKRFVFYKQRLRITIVYFVPYY